MLYIILAAVALIILFFVWAHYKVEADEAKLIEEDPGALYPFFGVFTDRLKYTTSSGAQDVILSNTDTGKIYIGGKIYNMLDISSCRAETLGGHTSTSYETVQTISTNTGSAIGRAIVGGVVGGGVGAIIGASTASREIKPKTIAKKQYVSKFHRLIIEFKGNRQFDSTITTNSKNKMEEMVDFINGEINYFKSKMIESEKKTEKAIKSKLIESEKRTDKTIASFINSPLDYSFNHVKAFDPNVIAISDLLLLSKDFTLKCAKIMNLICLQRIDVDEKRGVIFSSYSVNFEDCKKDAVKLKNYLIEKFGQPDKDCDIQSLTTDKMDESTNLYWGKHASYMFYHNTKNAHYYCRIRLLRKKEFKKEKVSLSIEYQQKLSDYQELMKNPLNYSISHLTSIDPKCFIYKGNDYTLSKEAVKLCSNIAGLKALNYIHINSEEILFSSESNVFEEIRDDTMTLYQMGIQWLGEANQILNEITEETIRNKIRIEWPNSSLLFTNFDKEDKIYSITLILERREIKQ